MTSAPPHQPESGPPEDETDLPDVNTVPQGAVAVFQAPRAVRQPGSPPRSAFGSDTGQPAEAPRPTTPVRSPETGRAQTVRPETTPSLEPVSPAPAAGPDVESPFLDLFVASPGGGQGSRQNDAPESPVGATTAAPPARRTDSEAASWRGSGPVAPAAPISPAPAPAPVPSVPANPPVSQNPPSPPSPPDMPVVPGLAALAPPEPAVPVSPARPMPPSGGVPGPALSPVPLPAEDTAPVPLPAGHVAPGPNGNGHHAYPPPVTPEGPAPQPAGPEPEGWATALAAPEEPAEPATEPGRGGRKKARRKASHTASPDRTEPGQHAPAESGKPDKAPRTPKAGKPATARRAPKAAKPVTDGKRPRYKDRDAAVDLAITEIAGHLTFTPNTVTAWYWLPEVRWAFRPDPERESLLSAIAEQYAGLAGFRLHLRRTTRPFPADEWARTIDHNTPHPLPTVDSAPSWSDHLVAAQHHLLSVNHAEGQSYLGVTFARRSLGDTMKERVRHLFGKGIADGERRRLARMVEQFDEVLGSFGMRGRRASSQELEWLLYRSVALCMSPPRRLSPVSDGHWERPDLLALTEQIERYRSPYGSTVKLVNRLTGEERHVAVLAVGRMEPLEIPERHEPWLHFHERLPWPMELSSRVDVLGQGDSFRNLEHRLRMIRSQQLDYAEHGMDAPPELERLAQRALHIGDDMTTGLPTDASRVHGWHRLAVGASTREECLERARRIIQLYSRELRVSLQHPKNQDWLAREFIPGEPIANTGYLRRMPVRLLAAALPQAASNVGDRRGDLIGRTAGTCRRPVFLDLHFPMEVRERSGLAVFVAEPGGGKSTLLGALGYLAARRGVQVTLLDPSGPLARLAAMPELKPFSRVLNLTGSEQGTLAPYSLIPTPLRVHYAADPSGDREFEIALSNSRAERRMLVQDICMMLVPPQVAREASTATLLRHAVREVPAEEMSTLDDIVARLRQMGSDEARELSNLLLDTAEMPLALLFFGSQPQNLLGSDAALTIITMAGLRLPDLKIEREYWSAEEALALPMLHTAHRLAVRRCYGGSMGQRKMVGLDEAHFMEGWRSGRSFLVRLARDSRKWNLAALVASQNPGDILGLDVQNLVSTVFVGRIAEDSEIASEALRLLRVPTGVGYEQTLASLSAVDTASASRLGFREFVMRDVDGRVQKVRVDVSYVPELLTYLDTTPVAASAALPTSDLSGLNIDESEA